MENPTIPKNDAYDFDKLNAYEIKEIKKGKNGEITLTLHMGKLSGVMRHAVPRGHSSDELKMVQVINGQIAGTFNAKNILFTFIKL